MLTRHIQAAMKHAQYEKLADKTGLAAFWSLALARTSGLLTASI
jgi:hypothetical protein